MPALIRIAVVYHSAWGHTARVADAVAAGAAAVAGTEVHRVPVDDIDDRWPLLDDADALIFGCPTYMGGVSAPFKAFMDATGSRWLKQRWRDKIAAAFTNSGAPSGDKLQTLVSLAVFAAQHGMIWIGNDVVHSSKPGSLNRAGSYLGVMTESLDAPVSETNPPAHDLQTAQLLGSRVAAIAGRFRAGGPRPPD